MNLNELSKQIHQGNVDRGFYEKPAEKGTILMLVTSELSEALEADRKGKYANLEYFRNRISEIADSKEGEISNKEYALVFKNTLKDTYEDEIADAIIRLLDHCGHLNIDIDAHIAAKLKYNATRPHKHGKSY
jgi:NTP pyrophosphatase (non-canonical NTP hydrolase)